ncbi:hypothetical protein B0H16DRAFT_1746390 [Mycena metata]|uniref:Uncharacterized protein n=1 Tax=Mycena metata TaxID=1033252 RepID=A0AAD7GYJ9_9AGAR|nr:hypothetical protein B0H16DRAFT_1746390 [Mycena metata]
MTRSRTAAAVHDASRPYSLIQDPALRLPVTLSAPDALRYINREPNLGRQIGLQLANPGLYAHDRTSSGVLYCVVLFPTHARILLDQGRLSEADFFALADLKFGVTRNLSSQRRDYAACEGNGHSHLWLFPVPTRQRCRLERLLHLSCSCFAPRDSTPCSGKRCHRTHREFWPLAPLGSLEQVKGRLRAFQVAIGETEHQINTLDESKLRFS